MNHFQYNLRENFVSELVTIVMRSDRDGDMKINANEGQVLALRLSVEVRIQTNVDNTFIIPSILFTPQYYVNIQY